MTEMSGEAKAIVTTNEAIGAIVESLDRIRYGSIAVTVHEGRIVQLDITEKRRWGR